MSYRRLSFNLQPKTGVFALLLFITLNAAGVMAESAPVAPPQEAAPPMTSVIADETGAELLMADLAGRPVLVNFWATWCAPCRREMPLFDALQARYANAPLRVLAVALDRGSADKPRKFLTDLKVEHLTQAHDPSYASARAVGLIGLPTTLVLDASGREIGRLAGEAEWNSPAVHALLDAELEKIEAAD